MTKKIYLEPFKKRPGSLCFTLLTSTLFVAYQTLNTLSILFCCKFPRKQISHTLLLGLKPVDLSILFQFMEYKL